jgi:hypothetical protein
MKLLKTIFNHFLGILTTAAVAVIDIKIRGLRIKSNKEE